MPVYLSEQTLKEAVDRLATSSAASRLADYLIFKRAFKIACDVAHAVNEPEPVSVVTGTRARAFVQAIEQLTLRVRQEDERPGMENPYYVPFGSMRDATRGYRSKKFISTGSSDTVGRWQARSAKPLVLVPDTKPKAYRFEERSKKELEGFFIVKNAAEHFSGERPRLLDTAVWWFRFADLESRFGPEPTPQSLIREFIEDFGLTEIEIAALFADSYETASQTTPAADVAAEEAEEA